MNAVTLIGIDLGKYSFHLHAQDGLGRMVFRKKLRIAGRGSHRGAGNYLPIMTPDRFTQASLVSTPDYLAKTGLTIDSASGRRGRRSPDLLLAEVTVAISRAVSQRARPFR